jgi:hypothetical protein
MPSVRLWLYDQLAFHPAVAEPATSATMKGVSSWCTRHKLHYRRNSFFELEAVLIRTEDEAGIALLVRSIRVEIDFEAVLPVESRNSQLHVGAYLYAHGGWTEFILLCRHLNDLWALFRLRSIRLLGEAISDRETTNQEQ